MRKTLLGAVGAAVLLTVGGAAFAQEGPTGLVKYRQTLMKAIGSHTGSMAMVGKGEVELNQIHLMNHALAIAHSATLIPDAFADPCEKESASAEKPKEGEEPKVCAGGAGPNEASAKIWENWDDFVAKAVALEAEALVMAELAARGDIEGATKQLGAVGGTCGACHKEYREKKS